MAKITKSQVFTKATIYYDPDDETWKIEEQGKDGSQTFLLVDDVLVHWRDLEGVTITIKKDADYNPQEEV